MDLKSTNRLLRVIVALLLRQRVSDPLTLREQIETLNNLGFKPKEISEIIGRTNKYINKEFSLIRKFKKKNYDKK